MFCFAKNGSAQSESKRLDDPHEQKRLETKKLRRRPQDVLDCPITTVEKVFIRNRTEFRERLNYGEIRLLLAGNAVAKKAISPEYSGEKLVCL